MEHCSGNTRRRTSASSIGLSVSSLADTCLRLDRGRVGFRWSEPQFELSTPPSSVVRLSEAGCAGPPTSDANDRLCSGRGRKSVPNADDSRRTGSACSEWRRFNVRSGPPELSQPTLTPSPSRQPSGWILDRCQEPTNTPSIFEDAAEPLREQRVVVEDQELLAAQEAVNAAGQVARDLRDACAVRVWCDASDVNRASRVMDHEQHVVDDEAGRRPRVNGEEVGGDM